MVNDFSKKEKVKLYGTSKNSVLLRTKPDFEGFGESKRGEILFIKGPLLEFSSERVI